MSAGASVGLGALAAIAAAACNAAAVPLQAAEARNVAQRATPSIQLIRRLLHRRRWIEGTVLLVIAWPLQVLAMSLAPLTVVQPVLASGLLMLIAIGALKLHEPVHRREILGVLAIIGGAVLLVLVTEGRDTLAHTSTARVAPPLAILAAVAGGAYLLERRRPRWSLLVVFGAGLAYAWADFGSKLLAEAGSAGDTGAVIGWLVGILAVGSIAFVGENFSLQRVPATIVAPIISAMKVPLPVLLALTIGGGYGGTRDVLAVLGAIVVAGGAAILARSPAVGAVGAGAPADERRGADAVANG